MSYAPPPPVTDLGLGQRLGLRPEDMLPAAEWARDRLRAGHVLEAFERFTQLSMAFPEYRPYQLGLAEAALGLGIPQLSLTCANAMIAADPERADGYVISGRACLMMEERAAAEEDFALAIAKAEQTPQDRDQARAGEVARRNLAALVAADE